MFVVFSRERKKNMLKTGKKRCVKNRVWTDFYSTSRKNTLADRSADPLLSVFMLGINRFVSSFIIIFHTVRHGNEAQPKLSPNYEAEAKGFTF